MRTFRTAAVAATALLLAACAQPGPDPDADLPGAVDGSSGVPAEFERRAQQVAQAWRDSAAAQDWATGLVLLEPPTVLPESVLADDVAEALRAGWLRTDLELSNADPGDGEARFPDGGALPVPLISARQAWQEVSSGEPECPDVPTPKPEPTASAGPDAAVDGPVACTVLTATAVELGAVTVETNRGPAQLPAWRFAVDGVAEPLARVAVAPEVLQQPPRLDGLDFRHFQGLATAMGLVAADGQQLTFHVGIGACDAPPLPLVFENDDVVVVGGVAELQPGVTECTDQLLVEEVTAELDQELGSRPVLATTGEVMAFGRW